MKNIIWKSRIYDLILYISKIIMKDSIKNDDCINFET